MKPTSSLNIFYLCLHLGIANDNGFKLNINAVPYHTIFLKYYYSMFPISIDLLIDVNIFSLKENG